ncbi:MAG: Holliday junction resolvase RuvX [Anaerolineae bacterium UTCFX2]|jgi:putative Holliday junction resolvase|nr:Holliday junction resolvase RuvX [Anaerolineales bacterium]OQY94073.1 MAG: Holliday junction resolvase RuvX [Anaerolineae bacterium UTCFX2]
MRVLAVDPGEKRLGIALSDTSAAIATPLTVLKHISYAVDAAAIAQIASEQQAELIIVGHALDEENRSTPQSRRAARLAAAIRSQTNLPVLLWDEFGSTQTALQARRTIGVRRSRRQDNIDALAAAVILQSYLDSQTDSS